MNKPPIFVVGVQRSGTTLLAALLAAHSRMSCGPETHFFRWLAEEEEPSRLCRADSWPETAVSFLSAITATTYSPPGRVRLIDRY
ncbi:MAG: sulfotransferase, partial [Anaerolineae bacterium]|nr:sulfotransferase [Anaerolineae bacterium]